MDLSPTQGKIISGSSYAGSVSVGHRFHFANGITYGQTPIDWDQLGYLARSLEPVSVGYSQVHVVCRGGMYSFSDFCQDCPGNGHSSPSGGNFLIVFNTEDPIYLQSTTDGRQFFGSVLAPFAEVTVDGSIGFIDGVVIALSYREVGADAGSLQLHGNSGSCAWAGVLSCNIARACASSSLVADSGCSTRQQDRRSLKKCRRKMKKGKCQKRRVREVKCSFTCAGCATSGSTF